MIRTTYTILLLLALIVFIGGCGNSGTSDYYGSASSSSSGGMGMGMGMGPGNGVENGNSQTDQSLQVNTPIPPPPASAVMNTTEQPADNGMADTSNSQDNMERKNLSPTAAKKDEVPLSSRSNTSEMDTVGSSKIGFIAKDGSVFTYYYTPSHVLR